MDSLIIFIRKCTPEIPYDQRLLCFDLPKPTIVCPRRKLICTKLAEKLSSLAIKI